MPSGFPRVEGRFYTPRSSGWGRVVAGTQHLSEWGALAWLVFFHTGRRAFTAEHLVSGRSSAPVLGAATRWAARFVATPPSVGWSMGAAGAHESPGGVSRRAGRFAVASPTARGSVFGVLFSRTLFQGCVDRGVAGFPGVEFSRRRMFFRGRNLCLRFRRCSRLTRLLMG